MRKPTANLARKKSPNRDRAAGVPAEHSVREIQSQPAIWTQTLDELEQNPTLEDLASTFSPRKPWLFLACGSSYYLSQLAAMLWTKLLRVPCTALPASELLFAPEDMLRQTGAEQVVLVSRSGETTEVLRCATMLRDRERIETLAVTCNPAGSLEKLCKHVLKLAWADERSMVMTRSFTSMLLAFQYLGAAFAGDPDLAAALKRLPEKTQPWLGKITDKIRAFAAARRFVDFVFLGHGTHYWLAREAALKVTEMSSSYAQAYHTLEFRHGPRSIAGREVLVTFLLSDASADEESLLVSELHELGAATFVIANRANATLKRSSDLLIELGMDEPESARLIPMAIPAHLLGVAAGLAKGLNPDKPRNLTRFVTLGPNGKPAEKRTNR